MSNPHEIGKRNHHHNSTSSEDGDESLSLSDLPLLPTTSNQEEEDADGKQLEIGDQSAGKIAVTTKTDNEVSDDFDFGSLVASLDAIDSDMCAADEVFFRGQILPYRHSVGAASATAFRSDLTRSISRSESMDRIVGSGFRSSGTASTSRSSSTRSSSINSSASAGKLSQNHTINLHKRPLKPRNNQFHSFPSPRPYDRAPNGPRLSTSGTTTSANKRSALWEIFRLGIVRTPEIELEDLKLRYGKHHNHRRVSSDVVISRNSSSGDSRSSGGDGKSVTNRSFRVDLKSVERKRRERKRKQKKKGGINFMKSCRCSVGALEPEKGGSERVVAVNRHGSGKEEDTEKQERKKEGRQRKQDVSRHHRMFEWLKDLKDLSHAAVLNDV